MYAEIRYVLEIVYVDASANGYSFTLHIWESTGALYSTSRVHVSIASLSRVNDNFFTLR